MLHTQIIHRRVIKGALKLHYLDEGILVLILFIQLLNFFCGTVIFYNDDFVIAISGTLHNRVHTTLQILRMVLVSYDYGDSGTAQHLIADTENSLAGSGTGNLEILQSMLLQMVCHSTLGRFNSIGFGTDAGSHAACM